MLSAPPLVRDDSRVLAGRVAELRELRGAAVAAAQNKRGWIGLVGGEPGIGKTRLAAELADELTSQGYRTAWVSCPEDAGAPPFWPWRQLLEQLDLAEALHTGRDEPDPELARFLLFESVAAVLRRMALAGPVLLVLDDLHWADPGSRRLLGRVRAELASMPVVVLGTYRDTEPGADELCAEVGPERHLILAGLPVDDLGAALVTATGEQLAGPLLAGLHARSGGNPYFAAEAVRLLRSEGELRDVTEVPAGLLPGTVRAVLERRLRRLPAGAVALLRTAALLGDDLGPDLVAKVAEVEPGPVVAAISIARTARLVVGDRFAHPLVREVLEAQLTATERVERHAAAGAVLAARYRAGTGTAAGAARHLLAAARLGEMGVAAEAVELARVAAADATRRAGHEDAVRLLAEALTVCSDGGERGGLLCELGEAALAVGDPERARAAYTEAAELARRTDRPHLLATSALGLAGGRGGFEIDLRDPERVAVLTEALDALPRDRSAQRVELLARLSVTLAFTGAERRRDGLSAEAVDLARRIGDPGLLAAALAARCDAVSGPDHVGERLAAAEEVTALAREAGDRCGELLGRRLAVVALAEAGRWPAVDAEIEAYAGVAEALGQLRLAWYAPLWRGARALMRGELDIADQRASRLAELAAASGSVNARLLGLVQRMVRSVNTGQGEELAADFVQMAALVPEQPLVAACSYAFLHAQLGQPEQSRVHLDRLVAAGADALPRDSEWLPAMAQVGVASVLVGHRGAAELAYRELSPYPELCAIEGIFAGTWGSVAAHLGLLARYLGDADRAAGHFASAVRLDAAAGAALGDRTRQWAGGTVRPAAGPAPIDTTAPIETTAPTARAAEREAAFYRDGEVWTVSFAGRTARLRDTKGLRDLAVLLARPGQQTHVTELAGGGSGPARIDADTGVLADRRALAAYRDRLREIDLALDEADAGADPLRAGRLSAEREALLGELSAVTGLGGRPRVGGSGTERVRKAVTNRIRQALDRVAEAHPELGRHLQASIHTGTWCRYEPEHAIAWRI